MKRKKNRPTSNPTAAPSASPPASNAGHDCSAHANLAPSASLHAPAEAGGATRRGALGWLSALVGFLGASAAGIPIVGYLLGPLFRSPPDQWVDLGSIDEFPVNQTRLVDLLNPLRRPWDGDAGKLAVYARREEGDAITVFAVNCTHLGCPVSWFPQSGLFLCPCHGGVYYANGERASGPPPRGLYRYDSRIADGKLQVRLGHLPTLELPASSPEVKT